MQLKSCVHFCSSKYSRICGGVQCMQRRIYANELQSLNSPFTRLSDNFLCREKCVAIFSRTLWSSIQCDRVLKENWTIHIQRMYYGKLTNEERQKRRKKMPPSTISIHETNESEKSDERGKKCDEATRKARKRERKERATETEHTTNRRRAHKNKRI